MGGASPRCAAPIGRILRCRGPFEHGAPFTIGSTRVWGVSLGLPRLCPGKMALEEQCSAPPRWRSISLTHVEFPEGT